MVVVRCCPIPHISQWCFHLPCFYIWYLFGSVWIMILYYDNVHYSFYDFILIIDCSTTLAYGCDILSFPRLYDTMLGCSLCRSSLHHLGFSMSISFFLKYDILVFVFYWCCLFYQRVVPFVYKFEPKLASFRFYRICSFLYWLTEIPYHYRLVVWFPWIFIDVAV